MSNENQIDYIEIPATDLTGVRDFFGAMFGWEFHMWGDDYMSFNDGRLNGGFRRASEPAAGGGVLLVFYSADLERDRARVQKLGATISEDIFAFPGGRRFHFTDPVGNEYAIWSNKLEKNDGA
ncbi:MAG: VOC family protein [Gammaproteobacteria bacterium]